MVSPDDGTTVGTGWQDGGRHSVMVKAHAKTILVIPRHRRLKQGLMRKRIQQVATYRQTSNMFRAIESQRSLSRFIDAGGSHRMCS